MSIPGQIPPPSNSHNTIQEPIPLQRIVRGGFGLALGSYFNIVFGFFANLVLTRILAPEHYGIFSYALFFYTLLNLRTRLPVGYGFIQKKEVTPELIGTNQALNVGFSLAGLLLVGLAVPVLNAMGKPWEVAWIALALASAGIMDGIANTASALLNREFHFSWPSIANSIAFPVSYIPAIFLALQGWGAWSLFVQNLVYTLLQLILFSFIASRKVPHLWNMRWRFDWTLAKYLIGFSLTVSIGSFAAFLVGTFDNFLIGTFVGLETLGFYDRAYRLAQWPTLLVSGIIAKMTIYTYARLQDDPVRLKKAVSMSFWLITTLGLPIALAIFIAAPDLISWFYGDRWLPSVTYLRFLVIYSIIQPLLGDAGTLFIATGKPKLSVLISVSEAITLLLIGTILTLAFGAIGTSIAVGLSFLLGLALTYYYVRQVIQLNFLQSWGIPFVAGALTIISHFFLTRFFDTSTWPFYGRTILAGIYATLSYLTFLFAMQPRETIQRLQFLWQFIQNKKS